MRWWTWLLWVGVAWLVVGCGKREETRSETRGVIAGQVVLASVPGLDDPSRLRVDLGSGEGGVPVEADGAFVFADIEPDLYELTIAYQGGLTDDASDSGYQPYAVKVPLGKGDAVNLGRIELALGLGTVSGSVPGWEGGALGVKLRSGELVREVSVIDGEYRFESVPVGSYDLRVVTEESGESGCGGTALVAFHGHSVTEDLPISGTPRLTPGTGEVVSQNGSEWRVAGTEVSVNLDRHLPLARAWLGDDDPPAYTELDAGEIPAFAFDDLTEGTTTVNVQWTDVCGVESEPAVLTLLRDVNPPVLDAEPTFGKTQPTRSCVLSGGALYEASGLLASSATAVPLTLFADDAETPDRSRLTMKYVVCDMATPDVVTCDPELADATAMDYELMRSIAFGQTPGLKVIRAVVLDPSGNESEVLEARLCYDPEAPSDIVFEVLEIGEGGVIHTTHPTVRLLATGATVMKVGTSTGLAGVEPVPYESEFVFEFPPGDGPKTLYVQLGDDAGNWTSAYPAEVVLDTTASVTGTALRGGVPLDGGHGGITLTVVGTSVATTTASTGAFALTGIATDYPSETFQIEARQDGYVTQSFLVTLVPTQDYVRADPLILPELDELPPQDMAVVIEDGSGVIREPSAWVYVTGTGATQMKVGTTSGLAQVAWQPLMEAFVWDFTPSDGTKRLYLRFRDDAGNESGEIVAEAVLNTKGSVSGTVALLGETDHGGAQVALLGTSYVTTTDAAGSFAIENVTGGTYNLEITKQGFRPHRENSLYVRAAEDNDIGRVELDAYQARVIGQVVLEGWEGTLNHANAHVTLAHPTEPGKVFEDYTDAAGNFTLYVEPTNYPEHLSIALTGYETYEHPTTFAVGPDDTFNIGIVHLDASANALLGNVRLAGQSSHAGISVTVAGLNGEATEGELFEATTDAFGDYRLEGLPVGPYRVLYVYEPEVHRETYAVDVAIEPGPPTMLEPVVLRDRYLVIADGAEAAASPLVSVALGASDCLEQRVATSAASFSDPAWGWGPCVAVLPSFDLGAGDGVKTVYAQFKVQSDPTNPTDTVSDTIRLDTQGTISAFVHDGDGRVLGKNAVLHLALTGEPQARAWAVIAGYDDAVALYDDGTRGDDLAGDGIYQRDYVVTRVDDVDLAQVTGYLQDDLGNLGSRVATGRVSVKVPPLITNVEVVPNYLTGTVTIAWDTDEETTGVVHWGTSAVYGSDEASAALAVAHSVTFGAGLLDPGVTYHFSIEAIDAGGNVSATNDATFALVPARPVYVVAIGGIGRAHVRWEASSLAPLAGYNVYRATTSGGPYAKLNGEPCGYDSTDASCNPEAWIYEDETAQVGTTYYYVVRAVDPAGHEGLASDETSATPCAASSGPTAVQGDIEGVAVWSECGSPYHMTGSVAVGKNVEGSVLVIGPSTRVLAVGDYQLMVRSRGHVAAIGERGASARIEGKVVESEAGMAIIESATATPGTWRGVYFDFPNDGVIDSTESMDLSEGRYFGGPLFYRTRISHARESGLRVYERGVTVVRSTLRDNRASGTSREFGGGGGIRIADGWLVLRDSLVEQNNAGSGTDVGVGGGLYIGGGRTLILGSEISDNTVTSSWYERGGGIAVEHIGGAYGAITDATVAHVVLAQSRIAGNSAEYGGGIYWYASTDFADTLTVSDCVVRENQALIQGGGFYVVASAGQVNLLNTQISGNAIDSVNAYYGAGTYVSTEGYGKPLSVVAGCVVGGNTQPSQSPLLPADLMNVTLTRASTFIREHGATSPSPMLRNLNTANGGDAASYWSLAGTVAWSHFMGPTDAAGFRGFVVTGNLDGLKGNSLLTATSGPAVTTSYAYTQADRSSRESYWGDLCTGEMTSGTNPKNVSCIHDYYDDISLAEVDYSGYATTAFPMPRVTAPRFWYEYDALDTVTFEGYGYDYEDAAAAGCVDPENAVAGMWVSEGNEAVCTDADHDHWSCHRCPLDGPAYCPASCYLEASNLVWCRSEDDCTGANLLGTGRTLALPASALGVGTRRIWLWAYDANGQVGKVPTEVVVR